MFARFCFVGSESIDAWLSVCVCERMRHCKEPHAHCTRQSERVSCRGSRTASLHPGSLSPPQHSFVSTDIAACVRHCSLLARPDSQNPRRKPRRKPRERTSDEEGWGAGGEDRPAMPRRHRALDHRLGHDGASALPALSCPHTLATLVCMRSTAALVVYLHTAVLHICIRPLYVSAYGCPTPCLRN